MDCPDGVSFPVLPPSLGECQLNTPSHMPEQRGTKLSQTTPQDYLTGGANISSIKPALRF